MKIREVCGLCDSSIDVDDGVEPKRVFQESQSHPVKRYEVDAYGVVTEWRSQHHCLLEPKPEAQEGS